MEPEAPMVRREGSQMGEGEGVGMEMGELRERLFVDGYGRGRGEIGCRRESG